TLHVLRAAARALAYAHACGIVHRDVKGANILIDSDGRVMVSDFGVALRSADVTLTADGTVIGTPPFMSPEQCAGRRAGPQSDQYSLGIVAFQMLAGSVPFHADTLAGVMHHHFFTPVPDLPLVRDDLPPPLLDVPRPAPAPDWEHAPCRPHGGWPGSRRCGVAARPSVGRARPRRRRAGRFAFRPLSLGAAASPRDPSRGATDWQAPAAHDAYHRVDLDRRASGRHR